MKTSVVDAAVAEKLLQQAPDALVLADAHGNILFANAAVTSLFGYQLQELIGQSLETLMPQRYRRAHVHHRTAYAAEPTQRGMGQRGVALFGLRRDGTEFPVWVSLSPIQVGEQLLIAAAVRDVTEWQELTQHLREVSEEAKRANQTKGRFLATASHDLRQPLQALQLLNASLAAGIERNLGKADLRAIVLRQQHAIDTTTELLNALLDIGKLESGTVQVKLENVSMTQLIDELREQLESIAAAKQLVLTTDAANINISTDRVLIRQLIQNLVTNALKYTDRGSVSLKVLHSNAETAIEIGDSGVGIPRDQLAKIFDAYYQPHNARPDRPGVGLGLAIVKQIAELLGYGITVESQPGRGTTFRINVPTHLVTAGSANEIKAKSPFAIDLPKGRCILIVEDDRAVREAIALALELEGFETLSADSAAMADDIYAQHAARIAAVVSDYHVDVKHTGVEIVKQLRTAAPARLPAVFLTGDTSLALRAQQDLPDSRLLNKPVDVSQLVQALGELLSRAV